MKKTKMFLSLVLTTGLLSFTTVKNLNKKTDCTITSAISWKSKIIEVGEIIQGVPKKIQFEFKNTSKQDVLLSNVTGTCGCTATDYTKTPIAPKKTGTVMVTYNASNLGKFSKTITVTTNLETQPQVLTLQGTVIAAKLAN